MTQSVLEIQNIEKRFGGHVAVNRVNLNIAAGSLLGIIGPNGAGKSSFLNCLIGVYVPERGDILLGGESIVGKPTYQIMRKGIARTFQVPKIFQENTILENMLTPVLHLNEKRSALAEKASRLLNWVGLGGREHSLAKALSGGQQKLLEFARALMNDPDIVLLDEPFAGVHPNLKKVMVAGIRELHRQGKTVLLVSHDMPTLYQLTRDIIVLSQGAIIARGTPQQLQNDPLVVEAYFGG
ncbi:ABC transporter ATP-binding protein [Brevibacillus marinus]|uniref:ABC transporter ATP-binding protein n=1 Tax=Brevibacillus marinus TaxID=2496837 RepID=UPI000F82C1FC|nr:ABC transporter ATP-binding protein [Brevibacillus marinus]